MLLNRLTTKEKVTTTKIHTSYRKLLEPGVPTKIRLIKIETIHENVFFSNLAINQRQSLTENNWRVFFFSVLAGMSLTFAAETLEASQYGIKVASDTENYMTSVERVFTYTEICPEPGYDTETIPPETWPTEGALKLQDLSLSYLKGAPATLNDVSSLSLPRRKLV